MKIEEISDKTRIENFLRKDTLFHLYCIGDLDDFFWQNTKYFAYTLKGEIKAILMYYNDNQFPALLALNRGVLEISPDIIKSLTCLMPERFYAHITDDFRRIMNEFYEFRSHGIHYKMGLTDYSVLRKTDTSGVISLTKKDEEDIQTLYEISYPGNWFNSRMLETGQYYGIRKNGYLISIAGIHVYSETYRVAALGNITTHPEYRNKGLAGMVTAHLCKCLLDKVDHIGLNVHKNNLSAIRCYENLGFETIGTYEECTLTLKKQNRK